MDGLWLLFLVDAGVPSAALGLWDGVLGMGASIAGSLLGGALVARWSIVNTLVCVVPRWHCVTCR